MNLISQIMFWIKKYIQSGKPVLISFNAALQQHIPKIPYYNTSY